MSVKYYRDLLGHTARVEAFRAAIAATVRPGDAVLEVGAGIATFSFFAARAGASRVYAVDGDPIIHVARTTARLNDLDDVVRCVRGWIPDAEVPERCGVLIFEDFPPRLLNSHVYRLLEIVHDRYLEREARVIPSRATLQLAPVSSAALWREVEPFSDERAFGIDWTPTREYAVNSPLDVAIEASALAAPGVVVGEVDFARLSQAQQGGRAEWEFEQNTELHGLAYWFDLELGGGARLSNRPGSESASWGHLYLPFDQPLTVGAGQRGQGFVAAERDSLGRPSWLKWQLTVGEESRRGHEFSAEPASLSDLYLVPPEHIPHLSRSGRLARTVLGLADGTRSVLQIAEVVGHEDAEMSQEQAVRVVVGILRDHIAHESTFPQTRGSR